MSTKPPPFDPKSMLDLIDSTQATMLASFERLRALVQPQKPEFDPRDPANKTGEGKLTDQGIKVCFALFEGGEPRYAVSRALGISFGAADYRYRQWQRRR
jgi:hypothetical protein